MRDPAVVAAFTRAEWDLLVRLPGQVVIAATSAEADSPSRTVAEGLAGLDAIAAGRETPNSLVRAVVGAVYAEPAPAGPDSPVAEEFADRRAGLASVIRLCREAAAVLAARAGPDDRQAYRDWVIVIATRVCEASRSGGVLGVGGARIGTAERAFLTDLSVAFGG